MCIIPQISCWTALNCQLNENELPVVLIIDYLFVSFKAKISTKNSGNKGDIQIAD